MFLEYALLTGFVFIVAIEAFAPGSVINTALGADLHFRELLIKLPIF